MGMATALVSQCFSEATCLSHLLHISSSLNVWEGRFVSKKGMFRIKFQNSQCRLSSPLSVGIWLLVRLGEGHRLLEYEIWSTGIIGETYRNVLMKIGGQFTDTLKPYLGEGFHQKNIVRPFFLCKTTWGCMQHQGLGITSDANTNNGLLPHFSTT